ncbi:Bifunctional protein FolD protein [Candidatus Gugararchaeum adminiculabundum]|nr:Bifunctional protein FolD protein [Candidatus Gugararchaeum adminiculabundum]
MAAKILDGLKTREQMMSELKREIEQKQLKPKLSNVLVGNDPASVTYVGIKEKVGRSIGIVVETHRLPENTGEKDVIALVKKLSADKKVNGILVQLPLPKNINATKVLDCVSPEKDVDGLHYENLGKLASGRECLPTCTPRGVIELLKRNGVEISGKHAVVVGRSLSVGKPLALLLLAEDATVTICHSKTRNLKEITKQADILAVAIGKAKFVTADMVKQGAVVVDVGINRNAAGKMVGDVDFDAVSKIAGAITPVPGGVGPMTVAQLIKNVVEATKKQSGKQTAK